MKQLEFAIGDVHGRLDLLVGLVQRCRDYAAEQEASYWIHTLGDYVDRGPDSKGVIEYLMAADDIRCIKGNHEMMMVRARRPTGGWFADPQGDLDHWLDNGGVQTLMSYDSRGIFPSSPEWKGIVDAFRSGELVPEEHLEWMEDLPSMTLTKHRLFVHAGLMPHFEPGLQDEETMHWIRHKFLNANPVDFPGLDGRYIAHGHTPTWAGKPVAEDVEIREHRINLDTGSNFTGVQIAAVWDADLPGKPIGLLRFPK